MNKMISFLIILLFCNLGTFHAVLVPCLMSIIINSVCLGKNSFNELRSWFRESQIHKLEIISVFLAETVWSNF